MIYFVVNKLLQKTFCFFFIIPSTQRRVFLSSSDEKEIGEVGGGRKMILFEELQFSLSLTSRHIKCVAVEGKDE